MSGSLTLPMLGLILFCVLAETAREVCFKQAASENALLSALTKPVTWLGIVFWAVELLAWTAVLEHVPLSIAFPLMALSYVVIVFAGALIFKENINLRHATATMMIRPRMICCWLLSNPARISPLLIRPMSSEPTSAPITLPAPPNRLVPPRITAAITDSSSPVPHW